MEDDNQDEPSSETPTTPDTADIATSNEPQIVPEATISTADAEPPVPPETAPPTQAAEPDTTPVAPAAEVSSDSAQTPKSHKSLFIALIVVILLVIGGAAAAILNSKHNKSNQPVAATKPATKAAPKVVSAAKFAATFLDKPEAVTPTPSFFKNYAQLQNSECGTSAQTSASDCPDYQLSYNKIGTTKDGQAIIVFDNGQSGEAYEDYVALQTGVGKYAILGKFTYFAANTANYATDIANFKAALDPSTTLDMDTDLPDLHFNLKFSIKDASFDTDQYGSTDLPYGMPIHGDITDIRGPSYDPLEESAITQIGMDGPKTVYEARVRNADNYAVNNIYATINQDYVLSYQLVDDMAHYTANNSETNPPKITWSDGTSTNDIYSYSAQGCGAPGAYITAKNITASALTKVGTSPSGRTLYELPTNSPLFQEIYDGDYGSGTDLDVDANKNLTADQLQARHVVVVGQNGLGEWVVYKDGNYFGGGGCAKPVVYLYPTTTEQVSVSVGAKVTKSAPAYGTSGWVNVTAQPSGQLSYQGAKYNNLFWEGTGNGSYPVVDSGTIVSSAAAVSTIRTQLVAQGLKTSEINDFVDYWAPKLPHTKYVRLTWFDTKQLNGLAPLNVTPKPITVIRSFLDFQGLDRTFALPAQHFSAPTRSGFTVVEWGGLDRSAH